MNVQQPLADPIDVKAAPLPSGRTFVREINGRYRYLLRLAASPDSQRVLVAVHGISRNAELIMRCLAPLADIHNYTLIAPVFSYRDFPDYQRLGRLGRGARADLALLAMLQDAQQHLELAERFHIFGFSGGAQFAHRFVCAHPARVRSATLAAAGWYSDPTSRRRFPIGMGNTRRLADLNFAGDALAAIPILILAGENDTERDAALRCNARLDSSQGKNRLERARWFYKQLVGAQSSHSSEHQLTVLKNTGHDFAQAVLNGRLDRMLFEFCNNADPMSQV